MNRKVLLVVCFYVTGKFCISFSSMFFTQPASWPVESLSSNVRLCVSLFVSLFLTPPETVLNGDLYLNLVLQKF